MIDADQMEELIQDFMNALIFAKDKGISDSSAQLFAHAAVTKLSGSAKEANVTALPVCSTTTEKMTDKSIPESVNQPSLVTPVLANGPESKFIPATEKQKAYLKKYGIPFKDGITKHEAYLIISVHMRERNK